MSTDLWKFIAKILNDNQGVVEVALFTVTVLFAWASGIFQSLRRRPKFHITTIDGPNFCCILRTGAKYDDYDVHRSCFAIYLSVRNRGSASSSIEAVHIGYHWSVIPFSRKWWRYGIGWFWLTHQTTALTDFCAKIGSSTKVYPFLFQRSSISGKSAETFLQVGQATNGVVYFEQSDSFGGCFPRFVNGQTLVRVRLIDAFGRRHGKKLKLPVVSPEEALKYNPSFGQTLVAMRGEELSSDMEEAIAD